MTSPERDRILIVDDEEAILETMTFTFEEDYEVLTASSASKGLELLDRHAPVAVVVSDQRMPEMTGVEFLAEVFQRHPATVRIILTGFADMDATIGAINDGHVYAYVTKPWEPDQLKQVIRRAAEHHALALENERLLRELGQANVFLEAVMDKLDVGALAIDASGIVREANRPAREFLGLDQEPRGRKLEEILSAQGLEELAAAAGSMAAEECCPAEDIALSLNSRDLRLRVRVESLLDPERRNIGSVLLLREISHEPLRMRLEDLLRSAAREEDDLRGTFARLEPDLRAVAEQAKASSVESAGMSDLADRVARAVTAIDQWLAVDDSLVREDYPDAQVLLERLRVANARWPIADQIPVRVRELARAVETYYETGENPKRRTL
jgi:CheY-like chemotaxis protein